MTELRIDPEFQNHIPEISSEEYAQLEENLIENGCRDPLVSWQGILIDGHNRYQICFDNNLPFNVTEIDLPDRESVLDWIDRNQLGRRNLTPSQMSLIRGRVYNRRKKQGARTDLTSDQNDHKSTSEEMADQFGVSAPTIRRDGKLAEDVDNLKDHIPDIEKRVMSGEVTKSEITQAAEDPGKAKDVLAKKFTGDEEWCTPEEYIVSARQVIGSFDLDPASNEHAQKIVKASTYYTRDQDGLEHDWGGVVWMNPPYTARLINKFIDKLIQSYKDKKVTSAIILTNNCTDTSWFHSAANVASAICLTSGRISFQKDSGGRSSPTNGQVFFYFGDYPRSFKKEFSQYGLVMKKL